MAGLAEMGNRTIYALRQEAQIIERAVLLENESEGSSSNNLPMQADGMMLSSAYPGGNPSSSSSGSVEKVPTRRPNYYEDKAGESKARSLTPCLSRKGLINGKMGHS